jgi:hypothetical protein
MTRKQALTELRDKVRVGDATFATDAFDDVFQQVWIAGSFRGSLDAAKALHEAVLGGWGWAVAERQGYVEASVRKNSLFASEYYGSIADNPARAWLLAILEALIAQETDT